MSRQLATSRLLCPECPCWWDLTRTNCACCEEDQGEVSHLYKSTHIYTYLHIMYIYIR